METLLVPDHEAAGKAFRFLYGRWKRGAVKLEEVHIDVQIPLWTMETSSRSSLALLFVVQIPHGRWKHRAFNKHLRSA